MFKKNMSCKHVFCLFQISNIVFEGGNPNYLRYEMRNISQQLIVYLSGTTSPNTQYKLSMDFAGALTDDLRGLYLSEYKEGNTTM